MQIEETQNQKRKKHQLAQFNVDPVRDFINDKNKKELGHKCDTCFRQYFCNKSRNAIVIICEHYQQKEQQKQYYRK